MAAEMRGAARIRTIIAFDGKLRRTSDPIRVTRRIIVTFRRAPDN